MPSGPQVTLEEIAGLPSDAVGRREKQRLWAAVAELAAAREFDGD
jgi:hypothetical protein